MHYFLLWKRDYFSLHLREVSIRYAGCHLRTRSWSSPQHHLHHYLEHPCTPEIPPHGQLLLPAEILMCPCLGVCHSCRVNKGVALGRGEESHLVLLCSVCFSQPECFCPGVGIHFIVLGRQQRVWMSVACGFLFINGNLFHYC